MAGGEQYRNSSNINMNLCVGRVAYMTEYIIKTQSNGKSHVIVKFHAPVKNFRRVEVFKYRGKFYNVHIDKNDSVYGLERTEVTSWKEVTKGKKKLRVPDVCEYIPEPQLLNKIKGNPFKIAVEKIMTEIERESI